MAPALRTATARLASTSAEFLERSNRLTTEERFCRCRGNLRSGNSGKHAVRRDEDVEQQSCLMLHRTRHLFIRQQTAVILLRIDDWDYNFLPLTSGGIPSDVFATERKLKLNDSSIGLKYYGPAHTDSDISVTFAEADIVHVADTFWNGIYPFIDYSTGGSIDGMIAASDANLAATTDKTIIIPGHGKPVSNRTELKEFRDMLVAIRENVAALKKQGRSRDETVAAKPTAAFDAKFGNFVIDPGFFTRLVYQGV
jgi:hypothetical protein